jgi:polyphosphate kinase 2 (PPK2 family)
MNQPMPQRKVRVALLFGGRSGEHAISAATAAGVLKAIDREKYDVIPIAAPTDEEKARPYLWRFWRQLPERGRMTISDRSWYGRVLVERVEGFCTEADWMRAYSEINDFESELCRNDTVVVKFWLAISKEEQMKRFKAREETSFKRFKITEEDWRNRKKWPQYERAVNEMVERTSTDRAPWNVIASDDKPAASAEPFHDGNASAS